MEGLANTAEEHPGRHLALPVEEGLQTRTLLLRWGDAEAGAAFPGRSTMEVGM